MVWDVHTKIHTESLADGRERAMGIHTRTTTAPGLSEGQQHFVLGQGMDLTPWCGLLVYALHCKGIVVTSCRLWG